MNLTTATPVEIDTDLAGAYGRIADIQAKSARLGQRIRLIDEVEPGSYASKLPEYSPAARAKLVEEIECNRDAIDVINAEDVYPREAEYYRRGRWTRYYLVDNAGGHVHPDQSCSTCFPTTKYAWLVEQSGMSAEDLVKMAGEDACTVCFDWAPVSVLQQKSRLEAPERKKARLEREAKKAARDAAKAAKAITTPDGGALKVFTGHYPERQVVRQGVVVKVHPAHDAYDTIQTLHAARGWLADYYYYNKGGAHPSYRPESLDDVLKAVAHKEGKDVETVRTEAKKRASRR
jgi:hypothetical protein